ncbi:MAG: ZIP family metal transporter [Sulfolobales archaeon]|nr:ZIP family metal transporter [Sulfolobales archaeon]MDW8011143.1 ZIP family metal transporter [Sulfolobales archaeon]
MFEEPVGRVALLGLIPTLATLAGSTAVFLPFSLDEKFIDLALGFGSGLMVYVAFLELFAPSLELGGFGLSLAGFFAGVALIRALDELVPHARIVRGGERRNLTLVALAIAIHNIPEGLAVGSTSLYSLEAGLATAVAIAVQDVPEGLIVALAVASTYRKTLAAFATGALSALSEYLSALASMVGLVEPAATLPLLMSLSASAMMYVVIHEVAPEIFGHEHDEFATAGFIVGVVAGLVFGVL